MSRGKIVAKIAKYPHVVSNQVEFELNKRCLTRCTRLQEDFRKTLNEIDEKEYLSLRLVVAELRNHYATLHDIITKNLVICAVN